MNATALDQWLVEFFRTVDARDATAFAEAFTDDGRFRFGNGAPVVGREAVEVAAAGFFASIAGLSHDIVAVWSGHWEGGDVRSVEATVTYTRLDGSRTEAIPVVTTIRLVGDRIADYRIFMDIAPLFAT
ncbi:MAG: nuclear transport factor 2 family protein [Sporichthyaceae bacterium]